MLSVLRPFDWLILYVPPQCLLVLIEEWRNSGQHFVNQDTESPPIDRLFIGTILFDHLRSHVFWCAAESFPKLTLFEKACDAEVYEFKVAIFTHHHVLELEISVDDVILVQFADAERDLSRIELDNLFREAAMVFHGFQ